MHTYARVHSRIDGVGRLHRWLGIFVFSGWHRPTFTRLHAPSGCVICMFAVTEENLNQPPRPLPLYNARRAAPLRGPLVLPRPAPPAAANSDKPKISRPFAILFLPIRRQVLTTCRESDADYFNPFAATDGDVASRVMVRVYFNSLTLSLCFSTDPADSREPRKIQTPVVVI